MTTSEAEQSLPISGSYREISFWHDSFPGNLSPRPTLERDIDADVVIVGAGFTGLWTAYYLKELSPSLEIAILEKEIAGFGASGRNGGWVIAAIPATWGRLARESSREDAIAMQRALFATVDEVGRVSAAEGIDCHYHKGGTISLVRSEAKMVRARQRENECREWGFGEEDYQLLSAGEAREIARADGVLGALFSPHCAAIHPARLARGLAEVVEKRGVTIYERTPVVSIHPQAAATPRGVARGRYVIRATEGYTPNLAGQHRTLAPIYSLMIATEPLSQGVLDEVGLANRETFADLRNLIIYGQRTADGRIAFGGRGAPYHFASKVKPEFDRNDKIHSSLRETLVELFPVLRDVAITHRWGGPLGVPRDFFPTVSLDRTSGLGWAGGYVGEGVAASNLAGRTMAHLVTDTDADLVRLPWVNHQWKNWEREPLRWLGINGVLKGLATADNEEAKTGKPARSASLVFRLLNR
jgi:glycine/D-amino acid oxidase-like deaminating enzyme